MNRLSDPWCDNTEFYEWIQLHVKNLLKDKWEEERREGKEGRREGRKGGREEGGEAV